MKRIAALALLSVRVALRSRIVLTLLVLLAAVLLGLPTLVRGDGTLAGRLRVLNTYPPTAAMAILGLATLWAGCAVFAGELEAGRLQLTCLRPVRTLEIWVGQWLGLMLINLFFLALMMFCIHLGVAHAVRSVAPDDARRWTQPLAAVRPALLEPEAAERQLLEQWRATHRLPPDMPEAEARRQARRYLRAHQPLEPGDEIRLPVVLPRPLPADTDVLSLQLVAEPHGAMRRRLTGQIGVRDGIRDRVVIRDVDEILLPEQRFELPVSGWGGVTHLEVFFAYRAPETADAILLHPREALTVLLPRGTIHHHRLRVAGLLLSLLSLLAGVGITAGALFSHSVAAFFAPAVLLISLVGRFVAGQGAWWETEAPGWSDRISVLVVSVVARITDPVSGFHPISHLAENTWVDGATLSQAVWIRGVLYPLLLAGLAVLAMRRREVAR